MALAGGMRVAAALIAAKVAVHLALITRYGFHGDELYFIECGRHLALGYVDHPPLVPWIAGAVDAVAGPALWALRLPAVAAGAGAMAFVALTVREWGGGRVAQLLAGLSMLFAPAFLRMSSMLDIPVVEVLWCSAATYLVARILRRGERRLWLAVGLVLGLGLLTKHLVLLFGLGLGVGLLATVHRRELRTPWPWAGLCVAALLLAPNPWTSSSHATRAVRRWTASSPHSRGPSTPICRSTCAAIPPSRSRRGGTSSGPTGITGPGRT